VQSNGILERLHRTLLDEHFRVEGRRTWFESIEKMQAVLNEYLEGYNIKRPHQGRGMNGRTPIRAVTEGMPKTSNTEVTSQTKTARLKAARCLLQMRFLSAGIVGVDIAQDRPAESSYGK
jgi:hypothetical protein